MIKLTFTLLICLVLIAAAGAQTDSLPALPASGNTLLIQGDSTLTSEDLRFADSIARINRETEMTAKSMQAYNEGIAAFERQEYQKAVDKFSEAIAIRPDYNEALFNRGVALRKSGKLKEATEDFSLVIHRNSGESKYYYSRGECYTESGDYDLALTDYTTLMSLEPQSFK
ncbi:MAG: tetratricopeptide repeat protein, partial [Bacteroidales bacterium]|nr:tetratricopeptide repeat protein [Bacteroidales bacterium]